MARGGYQIIDLKNIPLPDDGGSVKIPNIYKLLARTRKPILVTNIVAIVTDELNIKLDDFFATKSQPNPNLYTLADYTTGNIIIITKNDTITINMTNFNANTMLGSTMIIDEANELNVDVTELPINDTLEIDEDGKLGVAPEATE